MNTSNKTTTTSEPPEWAEPLFERSADNAMNIFNNKQGFDTWQGNTVAAPSAQTQAGIQGLISTANQGGSLAQSPMDLANEMFRTGGLSGQAQRGIDQAFNMADGGGAAGAGQETAEKYYTDMAKGKMLGGSPFFDAQLQSQTDKIADQVNLSMAGAGRYGSGAHTGTLTDTLGDVRTKALHENFGRERAHQMEAIRGLTDADQSKFGNRLQAIQTGAGLEQQGAQTGLGYINALPTVQQNRVFDDNLRLQAGGMLDQQKQADLNNEIRKFTEEDMKPITRLGFLQAAASGAAGPYGTTHQQSQQPFNPMSLLSLFGLFGG